MSASASSNDIAIRALAPDEIGLAVEWAAREGWNPGLADAACFATVDPEGFLVAEINGEPVATISVVNYDERFAFLGFYIVRPDLRGRGIGIRLWQAGMAHAGERSVGLDGVVAQQANYTRSGFAFAYRNIRFGGRASLVAQGETVTLAAVDFDRIVASDAAVFPAARTEFLRAWIAMPDHRGHAVLRDGRLAAWGVIRPARSGFKIGPLVAEDVSSARAVLGVLIAEAGGSEVYLDVPEPNAEAVALARAAGLAPVFETARMYRGPVRPVDLGRVYGVTSFELG